MPIIGGTCCQWARAAYEQSPNKPITAGAIKTNSGHQVPTHFRRTSTMQHRHHILAVQLLLTAAFFLVSCASADTRDGNWMQLSTTGSPPSPRDSMAAVAFGEDIYTFGGTQRKAPELFGGPLLLLLFGVALYFLFLGLKDQPFANRVSGKPGSPESYRECLLQRRVSVPCAHRDLDPAHCES